MKINPPKLLDKLAQAFRIRTYSLRTEQAYSMWVRQYIRFHNMVHPREMGEVEVGKFLTHLSVDRGVSPNTQNQALNALKFLYRNVLNMPLDDVVGVVRSKKQQKLPVVMTQSEIRAILKEVESPYWLLARLMCGSGLQLRESLRLRIKDFDFNCRAIIVRNGKGGITALPSQTIHYEHCRCATPLPPISYGTVTPPVLPRLNPVAQPILSVVALLPKEQEPLGRECLPSSLVCEIRSPFLVV